MKNALLLSLFILLGFSNYQSIVMPNETGDAVFCQLDKQNIVGLDIIDDNDEPALFTLLSNESTQHFTESVDRVSFQLPLYHPSFQSRAPPTFLI